MRYPKECPAFEVLVCTFDADPGHPSNSLGLGEGDVVVGEGLPEDSSEDRPYLLCASLKGPYMTNKCNRGFPFAREEIKPLTPAAEEMLHMVK